MKFKLRDRVWVIHEGKASNAFQVLEIHRRINTDESLEEWCYLGIDIDHLESTRLHFALDQVFATKQELIDSL